MKQLLVAMAVMVAILGGRADAQEVANDLNQLRVLVKPGDTLTVTDTAGQRAQGRLVQLDASAIVLELPDKQRRQFDGPMIDTVEKRGGDSLKNGALIGLISGGASGLTLTAILYSEGESEAGEAAQFALGAGLFYGGVGIAIGVGIDALIRGRRVIYAKAKSPPMITVAPLFDRQRQGLVLTFRH